MAIWETALGAVALAAGMGFSARFAFWRPDLEGLPILMYHYLTDDLAGTRWPKLRVSPSSFTRQLDELQGRGYETINFAEYLKSLNGEIELPVKPIIITFDDAARESLKLARTELAARGMKAVVFPPAALVGGANEWDRPKGEPVVELMGWDGLGELIESGWEVGSHTLTHPDLTSLRDEDLASELKDSKRILEKRLGRPVEVLAYPYGLNDDRVRSAARAAGYRLALGTRHGKNSPQGDPFDLRRIIIKRKDNLWDLALKLKKGRSTL